jgi:RHS repeat-associated protein
MRINASLTLIFDLQRKSQVKFPFGNSRLRTERNRLNFGASVPSVAMGLMHSQIQGVLGSCKTVLQTLVLVLLIAPFPKPAAAQTPSVNDAANIGLPENGVFTGSDFDTIQTNNGYIHVRIPLLDLKGRGPSFPVEFVYDSSSFYETVKTVSNGHGGYNNYYTWHLATAIPRGGAPWKLTSPLDYQITTQHTNTAVYCNTNVQFTAYFGTILMEPNGTTHHFVPDNNGNGNCFSPIPNGLLYADDGSGWVLRVDPNTGNPNFNNNVLDVIRKDGTEIVLTTTGTTLTDRNGNQIAFTSAGGGKITDTLGRGIGNGCDSTSTHCEIDYTDSNGQVQKILYTQTWQAFTVPSSGCSGFFCTPESDSWALITQITLPNGLQYNLSYSTASIGYPVLTGATLPTGASITWNYSSQFPYSQVVGSRTVTANGQNAVWKYTYASQTSMTVTDPALNDTRYTCQEMFSSQTTNDWNSSEVCQTIRVENFSGSAATGTLLKTVATDYDTSVFVVPIRETTTWAQTNQVSKVETDWDSFNTGQIDVSWKNPIHRREYAFGNGAPGPLVRTTTYNYQHLVNSSYRVANLAQFLTSQIVYEANGTTIHSQTAYTYDSTAISATSGVVNHDYTNFSSTKTVRGNPTLVQRWLNTTGSWLNTTNYYDDLGNLLQTQDPKSNNTYFDYTDSWTDATCAPSTGTTRAFVTTTTNALSQTTKAKYASCTSLPTSSTNLNGLVTTMKYDSMNRLSQKNSPDGGQVSTTYGTTLPLTNVTTGSINSSQSLITSKVFDDLGQVKQTQLNSDPQGVVYTDTTYDLLGRVSTVSNPHRTCGTDPTSSCGITTYGYDPLSRKTSEAYPDGSVLKTAYCDPSTLVTDPTGRWRRSTMDALGRLIEVDEPNAIGATVNPKGCPGTGDPIWITSYSYDVADNLTQVVQNGSHQRNFTYDSLSHLLTSANPETGTITYSYDADGNVQTKKDARAITTTYGYDALNRELTRTYSNSDPTVTTTYDQSACLGLAACQNIGHRTSMTDAAGSESWAYQQNNQGQYPDFPHILVDKRTTSGVTKTGSYYSDLAGNIRINIYPTGSRFDTAVSAANRVVQVYWGPQYVFSQEPATPGCPINNVCYTPQGTIYSMSIYHNGGTGFKGLNILETYNSRLQPQEIKASSSGGNALDLSYNYTDPVNGGNVGHVFGITNNLDTTRSQTFTYDQLNRITAGQTTSTFGTSPSHCWAETYQFDNSPTGGAWGNLTQITQPTNNSYTGCTYEVGFSKTADGNNHLSGLSYDASGNTIVDGYNSYTWNAESQLNVAAGSTTYLYDGDGRRVAKANSAIPPVPYKLYWYGPGGEILGETDASGNTLNEYVFFAGKRVAMLPAGGNPILYAEDLLGTSRINTTNAGVVCYDADFYPYGGERTPYTDTCTQNFYKFEGKERDAETGNDDFGARYYANRFGRWLSSDWSDVPVAVPYANLTNPQTLNLYSMVADDPESFADLDGHDYICISCAIAAIERNASVQVLIGEAKGVANNVASNFTNKEALPPSNPLQQAGSDFVKGPLTTGVSIGALFLGDEEESPGPRTLKPGPFAGESVPASGPKITPAEQVEVNRIGKDEGCHTCGTNDPGTKDGHFVGDHQPPNAMRQEGQSQNLYPQCLSCSRTQGGEVRAATRSQQSPPPQPPAQPPQKPLNPQQP